MPTTIAKGRMYTVTTAVNDGLLAAMRKAPDSATDAMEAGADYWHRGVLPEHFKKGAHQKYGYADRAISYLRQKNGKPDLVKTATMRRELIARADIKRQSGSVQLKMQARVLNLAPTMPQNSDDLYVKHKNKSKRGYPNLKREIKIILLDEREDVAQVVAWHLQNSFDRSGAGFAAALSAQLNAKFDRNRPD